MTLKPEERAVRGDAWLLLKPVLILFSRREAVFHGLSLVPCFINIVPEFLSS